MALKRTSIMLCLIESGQTSWSIDGRIQGSSDLPLSDIGRQAVMADLDQLNPVRASMVYHPADEAATATAELCARQIGARTKAVNELADPHLGLLEGGTEQEFADRFPTRYRQWEDDPLSLTPPEGEAMHDAAVRLFGAIAKILKRSRSHEAAVVMHPLGLGLVRSWMADRPFNDFRNMLKGRPRVERYAVPVHMIEELERAPDSAYARS